MPDSIVHLNGLEFGYATDSGPPLLSGLDLEVGARERVAITGPSGCGKTTLLHLVSGLLTPTAGTVRVLGTRVSSLSQEQAGEFRRRHIGFIFQNFLLLPHLTIQENVAVPLALCQRRWRPTDTDRLLERLDLGHRRDAYPAALSGGELQRAAMARALIHKPPLVLADEPTGNLDPAHAGKALDLLTETVQDLGTTLLMVTHSEQAARRADRIFDMAGRGPI